MSTFKSPSLTLTKVDQVIYTAPPSGAIIIGILAAHNGGNQSNYGLDLRRKRGSIYVSLLGKDSQVYHQSALSVDSGKIVLQGGDQIVAKALTADTSVAENCVDLSISLMEQ